MDKNKQQLFRQLLQSQFQTSDVLWKRIKEGLNKADPETACAILTELQHHMIDILQGLGADKSDRIKDGEDLLDNIIS